MSEMESGWGETVAIEMEYRHLHDLLMAAESGVRTAPESGIHPIELEDWQDAIAVFKRQFKEKEPENVGVDRWPDSLKEAFAKDIERQQRETSQEDN